MKIPPEKLKEFEDSAKGLRYGKVSLVIHLKNGKARYEIKMKKTFPAEEIETVAGATTVDVKGAGAAPF